MSRRHYTPAEEQQIRELYPDMKTEKLAQLMGRETHSIYQKAKAMGIKKSEAYLATPDACRLRRGGNIGVDTRFKKGVPTWNKGISYQAGGASVQTQFKPGSKPHNWVPVGSERLLEGYLQRKITDTGYPPRDWRMVHVMVWEEANGPVPPRHVVIFKNKDKSDIRLDNLELISRGDLMKRNSYHQYGKEVAQLVQLKGAITRQINKREGKS